MVQTATHLRDRSPILALKALWGRGEDAARPPARFPRADRLRTFREPPQRARGREGPGGAAGGRTPASRPHARSRGPALQRPGGGTLDPRGVRRATQRGETCPLRPDGRAQGPAVPGLPAVLPGAGLAPSRSHAPARAPVEGRPVSRRDGPEPRSPGNRRTERNLSPFGRPRREAAEPSRRTRRRTGGRARGGRPGGPGSPLG